ncbi:hypothetical protein D3C71_1226500 [compost metagenome]
MRGADGSVRPVPVAGIRQDGDAIVVNATLSDFQAAAPVAGEAPAATPPVDSTDAPAEPTEPVEPPAADEPTA